MKRLIIRTSFLLLAGSAFAQTDNFDDGDAVDWTEVDPLGGLGAGPITSFEVTNGEYRIRSGVSPNPAAAGPGRGASFRQDVILTDSFFISVDVPAFDSALEQAFGVFAFVQPNPTLGTTDAYSFTYQPITNDIQITRVVNEQQENTFESNVDLAVAPDNAIRLVFFGNGGNMEGRIYNLDDLSTPLAVTTASDTMFTSGAAGLVVLNNQENGSGTADATFDNYVANDGTLPALEIVVEVDEFVVRFPDWVIDPMFQRSLSMEDGSWMGIPVSQLDRNGGFFEFASEFVLAPLEFYRLLQVSE